MIDPQDIDPDTGQPYANYSSPALNTSFHDHERDVDLEDEDHCWDGREHQWRMTADSHDIYRCERCGYEDEA